MTNHCNDKNDSTVMIMMMAVKEGFGLRFLLKWMKSPPVPLNSCLSAAATQADNKTGSAFQIAGKQLADSQNINSDNDNNNKKPLRVDVCFSEGRKGKKRKDVHVCASRRV